MYDYYTAQYVYMIITQRNVYMIITRHNMFIGLLHGAIGLYDYYTAQYFYRIITRRSMFIGLLKAQYVYTIITRRNISFLLLFLRVSDLLLAYLLVVCCLYIHDKVMHALQASMHCVNLEL